MVSSERVTRRSAREATAAVAAVLQHTVDTIEEGRAENVAGDEPCTITGLDNSEVYVEPAPKKRKATKPAGATNRKKSKLRNLLVKMPNEVICEIVTYVLPIDLLRLVRSSKVFANLLLHTSTAYIWQAAREQLDDLPACPNFLTEQKYANLVFGTHCHSCGKDGVGHIKHLIPVLGMRWCSKCALELYHSQVYVQNPHWDGKNLYFWESVDLNLKPNHRHGKCVDLCARSDIEYVRNNFERLKEDRESLDAWRNQRRLEIQDRKNFSACLFHWLTARASQREAHLLSIRQQKMIDIKTRAQESFGVSQSVVAWIQDHEWAELPLMNVSKPLTAQAWVTIRPALEALVITSQANLLEIRLRSIRETLQPSIIQFYTEAMPSRVFNPHWSMVFEEPDVAVSLAEFAQNNLNAILESDATDLLPPSITGRVPEIIESIRSKGQHYYYNLIPPEKRIGTMEETLMLATSVFRRKEGDFHTPDVRCVPFDHTQHAFGGLWMKGLEKWPHEGSTEYDDVGAIVIQKVVVTLGGDPRIFTSTELDEHLPFVVCNKCAETVHGRQYGFTMFFSKASVHWQDHHRDESTSTSDWRLLDDVEKQAFIKFLGEQAGVDPDLLYIPKYHCLMCIDPHSDVHDMTELLNHLEQHNVEAADRSKPKYRMPSREKNGWQGKVIKKWLPAEDVHASKPNTKSSDINI